MHKNSHRWTVVLFTRGLKRPKKLLPALLLKEPLVYHPVCWPKQFYIFIFIQEPASGYTWKMPNFLLHICLTPFFKWRAGGREGLVRTALGPTGPAARLGCKWHNVNEFNIQLSFVWKLYVCILVTFTIVSSRCCKFTCVSYQMLALFNMYCKVLTKWPFCWVKEKLNCGSYYLTLFHYFCASHNFYCWPK